LSRHAAAIVVRRGASTVGARRRQRDHGALDGLEAAAHPGRHHLLELRQRPQRGLLDAADRARRRRWTARSPPRRLLLIEQERRQLGAGPEAVAAFHARRGLHRIAEIAQPLDVVADRRVSSPPAPAPARGPTRTPGLEEREQLQQPGRRLQHAGKPARHCGTILSAMQDSLSGMTKPTDIQPFRIEIPAAALDDLSQPPAADPLAAPAPVEDWSRGVPAGYLKESGELLALRLRLARPGARLNQFPQFTTTIDGQTIHFLHVRSPEPERAAAAHHARLAELLRGVR
jgi:hypothetical protein